MKKQLLVAVLLFALCLNVFAFLPPLQAEASTTIAEDQAALKALEAAANAAKAEKDKLQQNKHEYQQQYENKFDEKIGLEKEILLIENEILTVSSLVDGYNTQIVALTQKMYDEQEKLENFFDIYSKMLCYYYEYGTAGSFEVLLSSANISDFLTRLDYLGFVMEYNNKITDEITVAKNELQATMTEYTKSNEKLAENQKNLETTRLELAERQNELDSVMANITNNITYTENQINNYNKQSSTYDEQIKALNDQITQKYTYLEGDYSWPIDSVYWGSPNVVITSKYGWRISPITGKREFHNGLDICAPAGTPIHAVKGGIVTRSENTSGWGNVIVISHEDGTSTLYAHASKLLVTKGAVVVQNQVIARVGSTGMSTGNHLHFTVYEGGNTANPSEYLSDGFLKALNKRGFNLKSESAE